MTRNNYRPELDSLLAALRAAGYSLSTVDNGEDVRANPTDDLAARVLLATDEGTLIVSREGRKATLLLVFGNAPGELVADYSLQHSLEVVLDSEADLWASKEQPVLHFNTCDEIHAYYTSLRY